MGVRILHAQNRDSMSSNAVLFCSTTDWAFGPVFYDEENHDAYERAEAFLEWLRENGKVGPLTYTDAREFTDSELEHKYSEWLKQEAEQWTKKEKESDEEQVERIE